MSITLTLNTLGSNEGTPVPKTIDIRDWNAESKPQQSIHYTGRHDHGDLPHSEACGYYGELISSLNESKEYCDHYITDAMLSDKHGSNNSSLPSISPPDHNLTCDPDIGDDIFLREEKKRRV